MEEKVLECEEISGFKSKCDDISKKFIFIFIIQIFVICFSVIAIIFNSKNHNGIREIYFGSTAFVINIIYSIILFSLKKYDSEFGLAGIFNILSGIFTFIKLFLSYDFSSLVLYFFIAVFSLISLLKFAGAMSSCLYSVNVSISNSWNTYRKAYIITVILCGLGVLALKSGISLLTGFILIVCIIAVLWITIWNLVLLYKSFYAMKTFTQKLEESLADGTSFISEANKNFETKRKNIYEDKFEKGIRTLLFIILPFLILLVFFAYKDVQAYNKVVERKNALNKVLSESELILSDAVRRDNERKIKKILNEHPEIIEESKTKENFSIMEYALFYRKYNSVKALLEAGYNPNVRDCPIILLTGYPLNTFYQSKIYFLGDKNWISERNIPFIKLFLSYNVPTQAPMEYGCPLSSSISYMLGNKKEFPVVKLLVEEGHCDVNYTGASNFPPACFALREGNIYAAHYLIVQHKTDLTDEYARVASCALLSQLEYPSGSEEEKLKHEIIQELKNQGISFDSTAEFAERAKQEFKSLLFSLEKKAKEEHSNDWNIFNETIYFLNDYEAYSDILEILQPLFKN